ncbi:unnamed protein product, partial [Didymodactylos carnosus]
KLNHKSNLTFSYAVEVALRRLENSLREPYWDVTNEALTEHQSINDGLMGCATLFLLLQNKTCHLDQSHQQQQCLRSMYDRYLKRLFITSEWTKTISDVKINDIQENYSRYISVIADQLFQTVQRRNFLQFIDEEFLKNENETVSGFVLINEVLFSKTKKEDIEQNLIQMGIMKTLNHLNDDTWKLNYFIWILCCMVKQDNVSLETLKYYFTSKQLATLSSNTVDLEQNNIESLNEIDLLIFLIFCSYQILHVKDGVNPYHLYTLQLCSKEQANWWSIANINHEHVETDKSLTTDVQQSFSDGLSIIRLNGDQHNLPPLPIILKTARLLLTTAQILNSKQAHRTSWSYQQYANRYLSVAKSIMNTWPKKTMEFSNKTSNVKNHQLFTFLNKNLIDEMKNTNELLEQCNDLQRNIVSIEPEEEYQPRTSSPTSIKNENSFMQSIISPVVETKVNEDVTDANKEEKNNSFIPPISEMKIEEKHDTVTDDQTTRSSINETGEEDNEQVQSCSLPFVDLIFNHMADVNQWINKFCKSNELIQYDINTIRDRLEKLNRVTYDMVYSNVKKIQNFPTPFDAQPFTQPKHDEQQHVNLTTDYSQKVQLQDNFNALNQCQIQTNQMLADLTQHTNSNKNVSSYMSSIITENPFSYTSALQQLPMFSQPPQTSISSNIPLSTFPDEQIQQQKLTDEIYDYPDEYDYGEDNEDDYVVEEEPTDDNSKISNQVDEDDEENYSDYSDTDDDSFNADIINCMTDLKQRQMMNKPKAR